MVKESEVLSRILKYSVTNKDTESIVKELLARIKETDSKWNDLTESDIGVIFFESVAYIASLLNYNIDRQFLELNPKTATQDYSKRNIINFLGTRIKMADGAVGTAFLNITKEDNGKECVIPKYTVFTSQLEDQINYMYYVTEDVPFRLNNLENGRYYLDDGTYFQEVHQNSKVTGFTYSGQVFTGTRSVYRDGKIYDAEFSGGRPRILAVLGKDASFEISVPLKQGLPYVYKAQYKDIRNDKIIIGEQSASESDIKVETDGLEWTRVEDVFFYKDLTGSNSRVFSVRETANNELVIELPLAWKTSILSDLGYFEITYVSTVGAEASLQRGALLKLATDNNIYLDRPLSQVLKSVYTDLITLGVDRPDIDTSLALAVRRSRTMDTPISRQDYITLMDDMALVGKSIAYTIS